MLIPEQRQRAIAELLVLSEKFPKLDMPEGVIRQFATPPASPRECVFALTTETLSADLKTKVVPCQFGGTPTAVRAAASHPWDSRPPSRRTSWEA